MLPSPADRVYWRPVLMFLGAIVLALIGFDLLPDVSPFFQDIFVNLIEIQTFALTTIVIVNFMFVIVILILETLLSAVTGRRVQY
jgi:hypothetical protein